MAGGGGGGVDLVGDEVEVSGGDERQEESDLVMG